MSRKLTELFFKVKDRGVENDEDTQPVHTDTQGTNNDEDVQSVHDDIRDTNNDEDTKFIQHTNISVDRQM